MESKDPQGTKTPLIFIGVAILVIAVGVFVRSRNSSSSQPPEPQPGPASAPAQETITEITPDPEPMPAESPETEPQIKFSSLTATDDNGNNWRLGLKAIPPRVPEEATESGEPLLVRADVRGAGRYISIGLIIQGQAGEVYQPGASRNGRMMPAPTFQVFDEAGKIRGSGSFEYG